MKPVISLLLAALLVVPIASCGQQQAPAASSNPPAASAGMASSSSQQVTEEEPETPALSGTNPLTGEPMDAAYETLRPVAVMLNDLKAAQPQLGVSQADIIYEVPAEGGITRMMAVFQSLEGVGNLGSIRSARPYYLELALGHDALFVHAGGSPAAYQDIPAWGVDNMDGVNGGTDAKIFWRDPERRKNAGYEHSMLTSGENIQEYLNQGHFRTEHESSYSYTQRFAQDGTPSGVRKPRPYPSNIPTTKLPPLITTPLPEAMLWGSTAGPMWTAITVSRWWSPTYWCWRLQSL